MSDPENIPEPAQLLARLQEQDRALNDPEKSGALRELLRAGITVGKAANHLDLPISVAWRMVTSDKSAQKALKDGDDLRRRQLRSTLENRANDMLQVIVSLAHDPDVDGSVRLKAAQDILDRTGLLDKNTGKGGSGQQQAAAVIELSSVDKDFHDRLQRITVRAGARSDD
tara:strand:+ start:172 stop:681 length:510 start_codon:yes stop_codon:yes gene_type:complete